MNDPATTEIYTLSLHDALPISPRARTRARARPRAASRAARARPARPRPDRGRATRPRIRPARDPLRGGAARARSEEHTSELQSPVHLVCRLLLEKKKNKGEAPQ